MMKVFYLFGLTSLLLVSCSHDDDILQSTTNSGILLQKQIEIVGNQSSTSNFDYNGHKIISQTDSVKSFTYEYTNNLITKITFQAFDHPDHKREQILQYNTNNELVQMIELYHYGPNAPTGFKSVYAHNSDNTISYNQFKGDLNNQEIPNGSGIYFLNQEGEVAEQKQFSTNGILSFAVNFTYDAKNAPFSNVIGYDKLFYKNEGKRRNITSIFMDNENDPIEVVNNYGYNNDNFPTNLIIDHIDSNGSIQTKSVQYIYN